ncbi:GGDEF domain-containing protein [Rhizobium sp. 0TCS1.26]|uniref:GGDEF domain-containing protein n=1 Tax=Rhizobium sp. 0TCS1.26 TaxID=3142623 RepID=UPI003D2E690B
MTDHFAFILPFFMAVFGIIFLTAGTWSAARATWWGVGYLSAAVAFLMPVLTFLPVPLAAMIANLLFLTAFFAYGEALADRLGGPRLRRVRLLVVLLALPFLGHAVLIAADLRQEIIAGDLACGLLLLASVASVVRRAVLPVDRVLVAVAAMVVAETLLRLVLFVAMTSASAGLSTESYLSSSYAFYVQMGASMLAFLLALSVLATIVHDTVLGHRTAAEQDPLTGLLNRRGFDLGCGRATRSRALGAVVLGDIDRFKRVNDHFGHAAGDDVIRRFADLLRDTIPVGALAARFGGEEFVVFLPGLAAAEAGVLAERLREAFAAQAWIFHDDGVPITASFGVSALAASDHSVHDAIQRADARLYDAKCGGRNRVVVEGQSVGAANPSLRVVSIN